MKSAFSEKPEFAHAIGDSSCFFLRDIEMVDDLDDDEDT